MCDCVVNRFIQSLIGMIIRTVLYCIVGMLKVENFFSQCEKFFFRDSTRILDHVMMMSHPAELSMKT